MNIKQNMIRFLILFLIFLNIPAYASIDSDLNGFFNNLGYSTNVTSPNVYQGQQAGYYTGGSIYARNSGRTVQIAQIDLPSFRSGCGGIDLYTGGFSFINSSELQSTLTNVINNAKSYAFMLGLETVTPEIANVMKYLNSLASTVNNMNISSCETAAGLVGSIWPRTHEAQQQVCQDIGTNKGLFGDYASARQGCGPGGQTNSTLNSATGAYKNLVLNKGNIAWKALQQNSFLQNDNELAEFFMSLSGTVILNTGNDDNSNQQFKVLPSLATDQSLLKALLNGGTANIYVCDSTGSDGCLNPSVQTITINQNNSLGNQVKSSLNDMVNKIYSDQALTQEEVGLLNATSLPLYKILNVQAAFSGSQSVLNVNDYSDVIATDILFQYLNENLSLINASSMSLQYPEAVMDKYMKGVDQARTNLNEMKGSAYTQLNMAAKLISETQTFEQMLTGSLSARMNNTITWANNMRAS